MWTEGAEGPSNPQGENEGEGQNSVLGRTSGGEEEMVTCSGRLAQAI